MFFTLTDEQLEIIRFGKKEKADLLVTALAGAAKTSTLEKLSFEITSIPILAIAFNKRIADEMAQRFSPNTTCMTMNALGHRAWGRHLGKRLKLQKDKVRLIVKELIEDQPGPMREELYNSFGEISRGVSSLKSAGYIPDPPNGIRSLMTDDEAFVWLDPTPEDHVWDLIYEASQQSLAQALQGTIDFDDQILLPTLTRACQLNSAPLVLVDEAQDLSSLNHEMVAKIVNGNRLIAVGDANQAIYGFRGAHEDSMDLLQKRFKMQTRSLTISFRCAKKIVEHVHWKTPQMRAPDWAKEGSVTKLNDWSYNSIPDGSAVICRNNAPIFSFALNCLGAGRYPKIFGAQDIVKPILKIMSDALKPHMDARDALGLLTDWADRTSRRYKDKAAFYDRVHCVELFLCAEGVETVADAETKVKAIAQQEGNLLLMTGHKSKGFEFDRVYFLDEELVSNKNQDPNLRYVICTRAKEELIYIRSN